MLLSFIKSSNENKVSSQKQREDLNSNVMLTVADLEACIADSCKVVANSYGLFKNKAKEQVNGAKLSVCSASYHVYSALFVYLVLHAIFEM